MRRLISLAAVAAILAFVPVLGNEDDLSEQRYVLPALQTEHLSLLLRFSGIRRMKIRTEDTGSGDNLALIITGPEALHKSLAPFVEFLREETDSEARIQQSVERDRQRATGRRP